MLKDKRLEYTMDNNNYTNNVTVEQVSNSIECVACRRLAKFFGFALIVWLLEVVLIPYLLSFKSEKHNEVIVYAMLGVMFALGLAATLFMICHYASRVRTIERGVGVLPIYKVVFDKTVSNERAGTLFAVEIPDGSSKVVQTNLSFLPNKPDNVGKSFALVPPRYVADFIGKEVLVMYNPDKNKIYVLDFADKYLTTDTF